MKTQYLLLIQLCLIFVGCSSQPYTVDLRINGTIVDLLTYENRLIIEGTFDSGGKLNSYEIPVDTLKGYEEGQKVEVIVYSNTDADVWDPQNMKFDISVVE